MASPGPTTKTTFPKRAMILAAGLGVRMRPLTDLKPKALVEVAGKPLIGHTLDFLGAIEIETIVVNIHYRPDPLVDYLRSHPLSGRIVISEEREEILDTGGGVKKTLPHFRSEPFFVGNCDAYFQPGSGNPYRALADRYSGRGGLLLLEDTQRAVGYSGAGDFFLEGNDTLVRRGKNGKAPYVFTGLQILTPDLFAGMKDRVFSLNKIYDSAIANEALKGMVSTNPWFHIGDPEAVRAAEHFGSTRPGS